MFGASRLANVYKSVHMILENNEICQGWKKKDYSDISSFILLHNKQTKSA